MKSLKKTTMKALLSMALLFGFIPVWASQPKKYSESEYSAAVEDFRASIAQLEEESEVAAAEKASLQAEKNRLEALQGDVVRLRGLKLEGQINSLRPQVEEKQRAVTLLNDEISVLIGQLPQENQAQNKNFTDRFSKIMGLKPEQITVSESPLVQEPGKTAAATGPKVVEVSQPVDALALELNPNAIILIPENRQKGGKKRRHSFAGMVSILQSGITSDPGETNVKKIAMKEDAPDMVNIVEGLEEAKESMPGLTQQEAK